MKLCTAGIASGLIVLVSPAASFVPAPLAPQVGATATVASTRTTSPTALNLFAGGGGPKDGGGATNKGPNMMDQLAMLRKAQEMAGKKKKLDEELQKQEFTGSSANGKVTGYFKYVAVTNPMDANPEYDPIRFEFDDAYFAGASATDLSASVREAMCKSMENINIGVGEKYKVLQADLMALMGGQAPPPPPQ
jgi:hypothetical protein